MIDRSIIENALQSVEASRVAHYNKTRVAHYTKISTLLHFMPSGTGWSRARATPVQFLNDRMELYHGLKLLHEIVQKSPLSDGMVPDIIRQFLSLPGELETDAFQMSFSGSPDDLGQWRGYAANGMGCSIETDTLTLKKVADVAGWVIYDSKEQETFAREVLLGLNGVADQRRIEQIVAASASYMKHEGFSSEQEFRLLKFPDPAEVKFRESGDRVVPSVEILDGQNPLPVYRIIIGPGWQLSKLPPSELAQHHIPQAITRLLSARGLPDTDIESSKIPYDPQ